MDDDRDLEQTELAGLRPAAVAAWAAVTEATTKVAAATGSLWELTDSQLVTVLDVENTAAAARDGARLAVIRELDQRGHPTATGATSTAAWLAHRLLIDPARAHAEVRAAHQLDPDADVPPPPGTPTPNLPAGTLALAGTGRALLAGEISRAHADVIATLIRALPTPTTLGLSTLGLTTLGDRDDLHDRAQTWLLAQCRTFAPADVRRLGLHLRHVVDPDGVLADERHAEAHATFWVRPDPDGTSYRFGGQTDPLTGAQLQTFIDTHSKPRPATYPETGTRVPDPRTPDQRRAHAFTDLIRLATNADPATHGGLNTQLIVTTTLDTLQAQLGQHGHRCAETETGQPLSAALTRKLACDTNLIPATLNATGIPLDIAHPTRTIPTHLRRALTIRDRHCAFPTCTRPARWADGHHITHWADGGPTTLTNLVLLCGHHHDVIHHTPWTVTITNDRPVFTPPPHNTTTRKPRGPTRVDRST